MKTPSQFIGKPGDICWWTPEQVLGPLGLELLARVKEAMHKP